MAKSKKKAEMEGVFATGGDFYFSRRRLEPALADYTMLDLADVCGPARLAAGVDWAHSGPDRTVCTLLGRFAGTNTFGIVSQRRSAPAPCARALQRRAPT